MASKKTMKFLRQTVWERSDKHCFYCKCKMVFDGKLKNPTRMTIEHLIPKKDGGSNALGNLVAACLKCNKARGHRDIVEFVNGKPKPKPKKPEAAKPKQKLELCKCKPPFLMKRIGRDYWCRICKRQCLARAVAA